jgi:ABC-type polysaccharide/polyol phosphate export permease
LSGIVLGSAALGGLNLGAALWMNSVQGYHAVMGLLLFPLWIVSGAMFPIPQSGLWGWMAALNPMTHMTGLFQIGLLGPANYQQLLNHSLILLLQCLLAIWFTTAMMKTRKAAHV